MKLTPHLSIRTLFKTKAERELDRVMSVEGQLSRAEAAKLRELAQTLKADSVIVEIGTYRGRSAVALALGAKSGKGNAVFAIDPHSKFTGLYGGNFGPEDQAELYQNLSRCSVGDIVNVVSLSSEQVAANWMSKNIGLLWVDGDHRSEIVRQDLQNWYPYVVDGGIVAFHDNYSEGVKAVISNACAANRLQFRGEVDSLTWFEKRLIHA